MLPSKIFVIAAGWILTVNCFALNNFTQQPIHNNKPWIVSASMGYMEYQKMFREDGQTATARLSIGKTLFTIEQLFLDVGLELGIQSGNRMRLSLPESTIDILGGLPLELTVKPIMDLLVSAKVSPSEFFPLFLLLKGGGSYLRVMGDRGAVNDVNKLAPEVQAGFGYTISNQANITLLYQGIFGGHPKFQLNEATLTGDLSNASVAHAVLLGFAINI